MSILSEHILRAIEDEHRDLYEQIGELMALVEGDAEIPDLSAWAARLRGELHHLSPRLERHFQREERHFRLLAGDRPALAPDFEALAAEHEGFRQTMAELFERALGPEASLREDIQRRLIDFSAAVSDHERREMELLRQFR